MIPGTSRSGATILGAMLIGCSRPAAAEFSFFLGIPVMFGASFLKIVKFFIQGGWIFLCGVHLSGSWYGGRIWRVRVLDQVPDGICPQA